ncbi:Ku protein [Streptomyces sp. H10-C2]|uniref:non-homologous end joining protein Ku n=1 Tax=unclassified Streptomyces TaxID=2593676 RepID=UPI0024B980B2|nr:MULTISPECIES: Ku protein [unclassified Streptomyces]MDJ0347054.1 Ku protein [Streptomyces sp. PH10-H1]MDJ0375582.1 Ku protein [Streptomyces sp. H10-C2]
MKPLWSGTVSFGLVSIPVRLGSTVSSHKIPFRQMHKADHGPVRYRKKCELDDTVLNPDDIGRAYETPDGTLVEITDTELASMPLPTAKTIEISGFLDMAGVPGTQYATPYVLQPGPGGDKPYVLMRQALARSGKAAVGKVALHNKEQLVLIYAYEDVLIAHTLHWPDEMKPSAEAAPTGKVELADKEIEAAIALIEALGEADLDAYEDRYTAAVADLVRAKTEGAAPATKADKTAAHAEQVVDLMEALQASLAQAKKNPGQDATVHDITPAKKTAKKAAAKKTPGKKAAASGTPKASGGKKSTEKKSTPKKTPAKQAAARKRSA